MDQLTDTLALLDKLPQPAFCVQNNQIIRCNAAAAGYLLETGTDIQSILVNGHDEYAAFQGGCLYLTLALGQLHLGASVIRLGHCDVFCIEEDGDHRELQAMALAAQELRKPLTSVMTTAQNLFSTAGDDHDSKMLSQISHLNRGLFQMLRVIENMSDASRYIHASTARQEMVDVTSVVQEILEKAATLVSHAGITLEFSNQLQPIFSLIDREKLEKAILNIISNSVKFTPPSGTIRASLTRRGSHLYLSILDSGSGISENLQASIFSRYTRPAGLEDSRFGIGLGMVLIRSTAALHGGTVLVDQPGGSGTRITVSLAIRTDNRSRVETPRQMIDYSGGWDSSLTALSEILPADLFAPQSEK